jgi:hypothetical protein
MALQLSRRVSGLCPRPALPYGHRTMHILEFSRSSVELYGLYSACIGLALRRDARAPNA